MVTYTNALGSTLDLDSLTMRFVDLHSAGVVAPNHQTVVTPSRDGETWIRAVTPPRFLIYEGQLADAGWSFISTLRRQIIAALNPKLGMGYLTYTPVATSYQINAIVEDGLDFKDHQDDLRNFQELLNIVFRCPDPAWRVSPVNAPTLVIPNGGVTIPLSIVLPVTATSITGVITNTGDLDSYPVITAAGPFSGLVITNTTTGKKVAFPALSVASGSTLTIDMDARTATVGGVNVMPYRSSDSAAWPLVPGANSVTAQTSVGGTTVTLTYWSRLAGV